MIGRFWFGCDLRWFCVGWSYAIPWERKWSECNYFLCLLVYIFGNVGMNGMTSCQRFAAAKGRRLWLGAKEALRGNRTSGGRKNGRMSLICDHYSYVPWSCGVCLDRIKLGISLVFFSN